jgi:hypothetical protein
VPPGAEQRLADARAAIAGLDEEVLEVEAGLQRNVEKVEK